MEMPPPPADDGSYLPPPGASTSPPRTPPPAKPWTPEDWEAFLRVAGPIGKYLVESWKWKTDQDAKDREKWDQRVLWTLGILMAFLSGIIVLMAVLTWYGKVSGDALLFLVGAIASWILFATQRYLFEGEEPEQRPLL
jgi:hypothetical protein